LFDRFRVIGIAEGDQHRNFIHVQNSTGPLLFQKPDLRQSSLLSCWAIGCMTPFFREPLLKKTSCHCRH
jgi:hypothetical protein